MVYKARLGALLAKPCPRVQPANKLYHQNLQKQINIGSKTSLSHDSRVKCPMNSPGLSSRAEGRCSSRSTCSGNLPGHLSGLKLRGLPCVRFKSGQLIRRCTAGPSPDAVSLTTPPQSDRLPTKALLIASSCFALCVSNMDKVNLSIAIIPMAQELGWSSAETGLVQSSFFAGYILMNVPGGYLASRLGGRRTLPIGLATWSVATALVPVMAGTIGSMGVSRALVGLGQAVAPTSIVDMIARIVRKEERASAVSLAFAGLHVGSIVGLLAAPWIIDTLGWRALFVVFGMAGLLWYLAFEALMLEVLQKDPETAAALTASMAAGSKPETESEGSKTAAPQIPYRAFLRSTPVQALCFTHFSNNWFHYTMLAWLPTYFTDVLHLQDLGDTAHTSVFPPLAGIVCSVLAGPVADKLIAGGLPLPQIRKIMQNIAMLGPAACLVWVSVAGADDSQLLVPLISVSLGLSSFSLAGLYCTHQDMSPKYAGALLGLTNTTGALAGIAGVSAVGIIHELTHSWEAALLLPNIVMLLAGGLCFTLLCRNALVDFDAMDNTAFEAEHLLEAPRRAAAAAFQGVSAALERLLPHPPKELVQAARRTRLATMRAEASAAAASFTSVDAAAVAVALASNASTSASPGPGGASFSSLVSASLSSFQSGGGSEGSEGVMVSQWTMATIIPDFDGPSDSLEDFELEEAEDEVQRIVLEMRRRASEEEQQVKQ